MVSSQNPIYYPSWNLQGTNILFQMGYDLYTVAMDGTINQITRSGSRSHRRFSWSPDGSRITFDDSGTSGYADIFVSDADGTNRQQVTNHWQPDLDPRWSPDGEWIAFEAARTGKSELYIVRPDGSDLTKIADIQGALDISWSPSGKHLLYVTHKVKNRISIVDMVTLSNRHLTNDEWICVDDPIWSHNEEQILFVALTEDLIYGLQRHLKSVNSDGSEETTLLTVFETIDNKNISHPSWTPDTTGIVYELFSNGIQSIHKLDPEGGDSMNLTPYASYARSYDWR